MSFPSQGPDPSEVEWTASDAQLTIQAKAGSEIAFEMLYRRHYNPLYKFLAHMVGDDGVASELAQEAFLKAWRALPGLRDVSTFLGWLYRIAKNLACDYQRRTKHIHWESYDKKAQSAEMAGTIEPEAQIEAEELLRLALARLPLEYRACLILYHIEGRSKQRIAELLGIKESSVTTYLSYGLRELRYLLSEDVISQDVHSGKGRSD